MLLTQEVEVLRTRLETEFKHQRITDLENEVRNRKRIVVNLLAENVFEMKYGVKGSDDALKRKDREYMLDAMLANRLRKIQQVQLMYREAKERKEKLLEWGWHAEAVGHQQRIRVLQDIVVLLQEKNLLAEVQGAAKFTRVGEIERELDWPLELREKYGPIGSADYFSKKLRMQLDEHNAILNSVAKDIRINDTIQDEMILFLSKAFGYPNHAWVQVVKLQWNRKKPGLVFYAEQK